MYQFVIIQQNELKIWNCLLLYTGKDTLEWYGYYTYYSR